MNVKFIIFIMYNNFYYLEIAESPVVVEGRLAFVHSDVIITRRKFLDSFRVFAYRVSVHPFSDDLQQINNLI